MAATVWKGYLSFGLVSFPVRLYAAARPERVSLHMLHAKDLSRVKEVWYCTDEDKPIDRSEIVKGFEYGKGEYVAVTDEELKEMAPTTATAIEILQFVRSDEVDPIYLESSYYLGPEEATSKAYNLLWDALTETKHDAVAKIAMHNREHIAIIRPTKRGMILHTMYYPSELHEANAPRRGKADYSAKEMTLAKHLIDTLAGPFKPGQFHDEYRENVERLVQQKQKGKKPVPIRQPAKKEKVVDILTALQRSLESTRKSRSSRSAAVHKSPWKKKSRSAA